MVCLKVLKNFLVQICTGLVFISFNLSVLAWSNDTHKKITEYALKDISDVCVNFTDILNEACTLPDSDILEIGIPPFKGHFYDGHVGSRFDDDALERCRKHFDSSIKCWKSDKKKEAIKYLGMSLHYLQDMCCYMHLWGYTQNNFQPIKFFSHQFREPFVSKSNFGSLEEMAYYYSKESFDEYLKVQDKVLKFPLENIKEKIALDETCFNLAIDASVDLIELFKREIGMNISKIPNINMNSRLELTMLRRPDGAQFSIIKEIKNE